MLQDITVKFLFSYDNNNKFFEVIMNKKATLKLTLSAMFLAIGLVLPFLTGQIPQIGKMLLPMHLPVMLCGLICGWQYGLIVGATTPILRSLIFGMPILYPTAVGMMFELATYGLVVGLVYASVKKQNIFTVYISLIAAMLAGRIAYGCAMYLLLMIKAGSYTLSAFLASAFFEAIPGIIVQLVLIPALMLALDRIGLLPYKKKL